MKLPLSTKLKGVSSTFDFCESFILHIFEDEAAVSFRFKARFLSDIKNSNSNITVGSEKYVFNPYLKKWKSWRTFIVFSCHNLQMNVSGKHIRSMIGYNEVNECAHFAFGSSAVLLKFSQLSLTLLPHVNICLFTVVILAMTQCFKLEKTCAFLVVSCKTYKIIILPPLEVKSEWLLYS